MIQEFRTPESSVAGNLLANYAAGSEESPSLGSYLGFHRDLETGPDISDQTRVRKEKTVRVRISTA